MNKEIKGGLLPEKKDNRDFSFGKVFGTIDLSTIPDNFIVGEPKERRNPNDYCTAISTIMASELQEEKDLNFWWSFAISKRISGNPEKWGQQLHPALKAHVKRGAIEETDFDRGELSDNDLRYIDNYPKDLFEKAKKHQKQSYFRATGYSSRFDRYRATLWMNKAKRRAIITGAILHDAWLQAKDGIVREDGNPMLGDSFLIIGQKKIDGELYLIAQLSDRKLYFPRDIVNKHFTFGGFLFVDMPVEEAKRASWNFWQKVLAAIKNYIKNILR